MFESQIALLRCQSGTCTQVPIVEIILGYSYFMDHVTQVVLYLKGSDANHYHRNQVDDYKNGTRIKDNNTRNPVITIPSRGNVHHD